MDDNIGPIDFEAIFADMATRRQAAAANFEQTYVNFIGTPVENQLINTNALRDGWLAITNRAELVVACRHTEVNFDAVTKGDCFLLDHDGPAILGRIRVDNTDYVELAHMGPSDTPPRPGITQIPGFRSSHYDSDTRYVIYTLRRGFEAVKSAAKN